MTTQIQERDWEAISAYLDDQLNLKERSAFESRLQSESKLQTALEELRRTRLILRQAPKLRAPRGFILSPVMAGSKRSSRAASSAYPVLRLASAMAMVFFVLVTAGSFAIQFISPAQSVVVQDQEAGARPAAPFGMGGGGGGGAAEAPALAVLPTQEFGAAESAVDSSTPSAKALAVTPLPAEATTPTPEQMLAMASPKESSAADEAPLPAGVQEEAPSSRIVNQPAAQKAWSVLGILQIALAILALVTGLAALYLRRSSFR